MIDWKNVKDELPKEPKNGEEAKAILIIMYCSVYEGYFVDGLFWTGNDKDIDGDTTHWAELNLPLEIENG